MIDPDPLRGFQRSRETTAFCFNRFYRRLGGGGESGCSPMFVRAAIPAPPVFSLDQCSALPFDWRRGIAYQKLGSVRGREAELTFLHNLDGTQRTTQHEERPLAYCPSRVMSLCPNVGTDPGALCNPPLQMIARPTAATMAPYQNSKGLSQWCPSMTPLSPMPSRANPMKSRARIGGLTREFTGAKGVRWNDRLGKHRPPYRRDRLSKSC